MRFIPIVLITIIFSCNTQNKKDIQLLDAERRIDSIKACINQNDTIVNSKTSVEYVVVDSFYTVKIKLNGIDSIVTGYQFNCSTAAVLVPTLYAASDSTICLRRTSGQDYKEFLIAYPENNKLVIKNYETALTTQLNSNLVIYQDYKSGDIVKENFRTGKKEFYVLPPSYHLPIRITKANIITTTNRLRLEFSNDKKLSIKL